MNVQFFSFVISIEFRALSPNGVLFMAANNQTSQFVSIELVDGKLIYQFNTGSGLVRMKTTGVYTVGGVWYKVRPTKLLVSTRLNEAYLVCYWK